MRHPLTRRRALALALSKAKPGSVNYGTPGNGSTPHPAVALFERAAGIDLTHVPYALPRCWPARRHATRS